jgi:propanol-preferring alcohol dehydrogenase
LPITLGHENAGTVAQIGAGVEGLTVGDAVAVYGAWGCGACHVCRRGEEQQCDVRRWVGAGCDGGYAEYLRVPAARHLLPLAGLDPVQAAPLTDAGATPYRAIRRCLSVLEPGTALAVIGVGGLGHMAVQIAKAITPGTVVMAVDVVDERLQFAVELGADEVIDGRGDAAGEIMRRSDGAGARAVIDLVGSDETLRLADAVVGPGGMIVLVGGAGGGLQYRWHFGEAAITSTTWGSPSDLAAVLRLAALGRVRARVEHFPLEAINDVLARLERGEILGRAVVTP